MKPINDLSEFSCQRRNWPNLVGLFVLSLFLMPICENLVAGPSADNYLSGNVIDSAGNPIADAKLEAKAGMSETIETFSDKNGNFALGPFLNGARVYVKASANGYGFSRSDDIVAPREDLLILLQKNGVFVGRVKEALSESPLTNFEIEFHRKESAPLLSNETPGTRSIDSIDGTFQWPEVYSGTWTVTIVADGYQPKTISRIRREAQSIPGLIATVFLVENRHTCYTFSLWRDSTAILDFNAKVIAHIDAANQCFGYVQWLNAKPQVWSAQFGLTAIGTNLNWEGIEMGINEVLQ